MEGMTLYYYTVLTPQQPPATLTVGTLSNLLTPAKAAGTLLKPVGAPLTVLPVTVSVWQLNSIPILELVIILLLIDAPLAWVTMLRYGRIEMGCYAKVPVRRATKS